MLNHSSMKTWNIESADFQLFRSAISQAGETCEMVVNNRHWLSRPDMPL